MRRRAAIVCAGIVLLAGWPAAGFSPGPRRRLELIGVAGVCSEGPAQSCSQDRDCSSGFCVANRSAPAADGRRVSELALRGVLTLIVDEDVGGWNDGAAATADPTSWRLTFLVELTRAGAPLVFSEIYRLGAEFPGDANFECPDPLAAPPLPSFCVPGWREPAKEARVAGETRIQWATPGAALGRRLAQELLGDERAVAFLELVDPVERFDRSGASPLASVARFKVTLRFLLPE